MTEDALLDALRQAAAVQASGTGLRVDEICDHINMPPAKVRNLLRQAIEDGRVRMVWRTIIQLNGVPRRVPAYEAAP